MIDGYPRMVGALLVAPATGGDGDGPTWPFFVIGPIVFLVALAVAINPRLPWKLNPRMYKNPDAMEPSKTGEWAIRIGAIILMGIATTLVVVAIAKPS
ncbi:MAG: DUF6199 family natural product biosynthesis protein [Nakamurella sp.]